MKTIMITSFIMLSIHPLLPAQETIEKSFPLKSGQKVVLDLKFANEIKVGSWDKNELLIKAEVLINEGKLNHAHTIDTASDSNTLTILTGLDEGTLKESQQTECNNGSIYNFDDSKEGSTYRLCSKINYAIYLPADTNFKIETIAGNISMTNMKNAIEAKSISGSVDLIIAETQKVDVYLKSVMGQVLTDVDVNFANSSEKAIIRRQLSGKLNGGGEIIRLESVSGNVLLKSAN